MQKLNYLLAATMLAGTGLLTGCSGGPPPQTTTTTEETTQSTAPAPALAPVAPGTPGTVTTTQTSHSETYPAAQ
jgi:hypothetical protein